MSNPAAELNTAIRNEIVALLTCTGRKHLVEAAQTNDLVSVIGLLFAEIAELDNALLTFGKVDGLHDELQELRQQVKAGAEPYQKQIAELNRRIAALNMVNDMPPGIRDLLVDSFTKASAA